jgi:hypothetical protein
VRERSVSAAGILAERTQFDAAKTNGSSFNGLAATDCSRSVWMIPDQERPRVEQARAAGLDSLQTLCPYHVAILR